MSAIRMGVQVWPQTDDWNGLLATAQRIDGLRYDYLLGWDHLLSPVGDPQQPVLEGYAVLSAWAARTEHAKLGLLVGANAFRNPGLLAKTITTIDHISGGRAVLGLGAGWNEREHHAYGLDFGRSPGERLDWLEEALQIVTLLLAGREVTHSGERYAADKLKLEPPSLQPSIPVLVGGTGERKTLLSVARHADMWCAGISPHEAEHKLGVLREHCAAIGRDPCEIELGVNFNLAIRDDPDDARLALHSTFAARGLQPSRDDPTFWWGSPEMIVERIAPYLRLGFRTFITALPRPYDEETVDRLAGEVRPLVEARLAAMGIGEAST